MKKLIALVLALCCVLVLAGCRKNNLYGIGVQFGSDTSEEYRQSFIEKCDADAVIQDETDQNYYKLVFFYKSEQEVIKLTNKIFGEKYVIDANCIQIEASALDNMK